VGGFEIATLIGMALVGVGAVMGKLYGSSAERRFDRILLVTSLGVVVLLLIVGVIWCAFASDC